jgi:hypothetical protein
VRADTVYLGAPASLPEPPRDASLVAPVFPVSGIQSLVRASATGGESIVGRFDESFAVCGPGDTKGHTRTHLKPTAFIDGFDRAGAPRFSARMQDGVRDRTKWLCSYAIARLAALSTATRDAARGAAR